jgi:hypothetical protein
MDRAINLICGLFLAFGLVFCGVAIYFAHDTQSFVDRAVMVRGEVVDLQWERRTGNSSSSGNYHPVVRFTTDAGEQRTFRSSFGSSPPSYWVGETVDVLYDRTDTYDARIASFWSLWLVQLIFGGVGAVFLMLSGGVLFARLLAARRVRGLQRHGMPIETEFQSVELNGGLKVNGRSPWRIVSQWLDPGRNVLYLFHSENLWFDPTLYIKSKQVRVFIDPNDPKRYSMDVSFLPKLAN